MGTQLIRARRSFPSLLLGLAWLSLCLVPLSSPAKASDEANACADQEEPAPVTLSVQNEDILDIIALFSRSREVNIICTEEVSGKVSIELREVPFDEALQAVLSAVGLQVVKHSNIYYIQEATGGGGAQDFLRDVRTYRLNYAQPDDILPVVTGLLSGSGKATSYTPLRAVVVEDIPAVLESVGEVIASLDTQPRQVLIEAKIIQARISEDSSVGIDWTLFFDNMQGNVALEGFAAPGGEGLFVTWGDGDFTGALEALESVENLETLASPRLLAIDGTSAEIMVGGQLGFSVVTTVDNTVIQSVQFLDSGTKLQITPYIGDDGYILMKIHPELSDGVIQEGLPSKTTAEVNSDVLVKDGHTLLIGGLIREREEKTHRGVPLLKDIPYLGRLFGKYTKSSVREEIIIIITPRILAPGESADF
jgi:type II secretory pathway component GspD/PulD (secretin)